MAKGLFIKTWGCQMNAYDSAKMADVLAPLGYAPVDAPEAADLVILNTCHIREKASEKVFSELGRIRQKRDERAKAGGEQLIAVAGCVAQAEGAEIAERAPFVDLIFGPQTYHRLPEMVLKASGGERVINTELPVESKFDHLPEQAAPQGVSAFLSVQEGCDKFCSFCVVPYTRGAEASRPAAAVIAEAERQAAQGAHEIVLLGQNVNAYHGPGPDGRDWGLGRLIRHISSIPGVRRVRYTTSHPNDMGDELIEAHGDVPQLMPFLHLPIQSGSDRMLEAMNRKHSVDDYRRVIDRLRAARPDMAFSSDFIVGFPGETAADHQATLKLVEEIGFAQAYSFKYSRRPGTPAAAMQGQLAETVKAERLAELQALIWKQSRAYNSAMIGRRLPVLFDRAGRPGQIHGRTPYMQALHAHAPSRLIGRIVDVEITQAFDNSMTGTVVTTECDTLSADGTGCCPGILL